MTINRRTFIAAASAAALVASSPAGMASAEPTLEDALHTLSVDEMADLLSVCAPPLGGQVQMCRQALQGSLPALYERGWSTVKDIADSTSMSYLYDASVNLHGDLSEESVEAARRSFGALFHSTHFLEHWESVIFHQDMMRLHATFESQAHYVLKALTLSGREGVRQVLERSVSANTLDEYMTAFQIYLGARFRSEA